MSLEDPALSIYDIARVDSTRLDPVVGCGAKRQIQSNLAKGREYGSRWIVRGRGGGWATDE